MGVARGGPEAARMVVAGGDQEAANIIIVHSGEVLICSPHSPFQDVPGAAGRLLGWCGQRGSGGC